MTESDRGSEPFAYFSDDTIRLLRGDAAAVLATLAAGSIDCCVTSPPYYGLRDYGHDAQIGLEATVEDYVAALVDVFNEVYRLLTPDGTLWLNLGDSYGGAVRSNEGFNERSGNASGERKQERGRPSRRRDRVETTAPRKTSKSLLGVPWRVAFALQDAGWLLRNAIVWNKPNAMPESVTDRLSTRYEMLFLLVRSPRYAFDLDALREQPVRYPAGSRDASQPDRGSGAWDVAQQHGSAGYRGTHPAGRNPGDVWSIPTSPFAAAHFAAFPPEIPRRAISAGCVPGGTVLDPFHGSGTTGMVAQRLGRRYVGVDVNPAYLDLSLSTRLEAAPLPFDA